jgi:hypothetical protein
MPTSTPRCHSVLRYLVRSKVLSSLAQNRKIGSLKDVTAISKPKQKANVKRAANMFAVQVTSIDFPQTSLERFIRFLLCDLLENPALSACVDLHGAREPLFVAMFMGANVN